jgi:hypothetical protein
LAYRLSTLASREQLVDGVNWPGMAIGEA